MNLKKNIQKLLTEAAQKAGFAPRSVVISSSKDEKHGDLSSNLPLAMAKAAKKTPMVIAESIIGYFEKDEKIIADVFPSPPGFINFKINPSYYQSLIREIIKAGNAYGQSELGKNKTANVEFVSANPTGPLTVGHGRNAVLGDTVANILENHGYKVTREYYFNDAGRQMRILGDSVEARYREIVDGSSEFPEDGYQGEYIRDIARKIQEEHGNNIEKGDSVFRKSAEDAIFDEIKKSLKNLGIHHNKFSNEKTFYTSGAVEKVTSDLRNKGLIYEAEGATWFKTTELGMDQDRVLIKSSGEPTYRLPDIAYHINKVERDFDLIIDILGSDHVDTYPDVVAAVKALGYKTDHFNVLIHQFVTLLKNGQKVKMSTRKADFVTLKELVNNVGGDVVRYFFIMRSMNSHLNFDLDLAADQSENNPVFYLQYAHARICNIIKRGEGLEKDFMADYDPSLLTHLAEIELLKTMEQFPEVMATAQNQLEPQDIANYLQDLAARFHRFYVDCRVITNDNDLFAARIALITATKIVLANGLKVLGISAPERM